jgi:CO/xanthine dehydrogenase FAD-binding subunit
MTKRPAAYHRPATLEEALELILRPNVRPLAGGTKLLSGHITDAVVDLQDLPLSEVELTSDQLLVGATVTLVDLDRLLAAEQGIPGAEYDAWVTLLRGAIRLAGPNTYRNAATVGGSIAARLPDSELLALLLVFDARLNLLTPEEREMTLADYLVAAEQPKGLITEVRLRPEVGRGASERVARTPADYPIVSVTAWASEDGTPRLAATGIDDRPVRLAAAEEALAAGLTEESRTRAVQAAQEQARHPGDFRGDAGYRADMAAVLTRRVLARLS